MGKTRAIRIKLNRKFEEKKFKTDVNVVTYDKNKKVEFEPMCVFSEEKSRWRFWRSARELIFFVEGQVNALRFDKVTDKISASWTQKDVKELVKKEMAKALMEHKPMTWTQFIIILIPVLATLGLVFLIAKRIGAF